jgi:phosphotransferase system enzyme I (PtsI)
MTFSIHGLAVARGIAIGRAVLVASSRVDVAHYFIQPEQVESEIDRVRQGRNAVVEELQRLQADMPADAPHELGALLDVHLMLLQDDAGRGRQALDHRAPVQRRMGADHPAGGDCAPVRRDGGRVPARAQGRPGAGGRAHPALHEGRGQPGGAPREPRRKTQQDLLLDDTVDVPLVLVAHDLSPADMLQFKQSVFAGFVTDVGGKTSHTAIVARSMDIPAVVGARAASQLVRQDDWVIIDGDAGVMIVDPSPIILAEYGFRQRQIELERERLARLRHTPAVTIDGQKIELLANIEQPR